MCNYLVSVQDMRFLSGHWLVLNTSWHDETIPHIQHDIPRSELDRKAPLEHQKQLILVLVLVPDKVTLELGKFDMLSI